MPPALIHSETFRVCFFDCEPSGRISIPALCRYAQEAADCHCRTFAMSLLELRAANRAWLLTRFQLRVRDLPRVGEQIRVETWASARTNGLRALRDFRVLAADGETLAEALSVWLMFDTARRRPVRLPEVVMQIRNAERTINEEFDYPRLAPPDHSRVTDRFPVRWRDLDANNHVNNVNYIEWALESVPVAIRQDKRLSLLDVEFLGEARLGGEVVSSAQDASDVSAITFSHRLQSGDESLLALLKTIWA